MSSDEEQIVTPPDSPTLPPKAEKEPPKEGKEVKQDEDSFFLQTVLRETENKLTGSPILQEELQPGWKEATAPDGRIYYWNVETKETKWEKPVVKNRRAQFATRSKSSANLDELMDDRWFFGNISRTQAELILQNLHQSPSGGSFVSDKGAILIRENKVPLGSYYISKIIFSTRFIKHSLVVHDDFYGYLFENSDIDKNNYKFLKQLIHRSPECQGYVPARTLLTISQRAAHMTDVDKQRKLSSESPGSRSSMALTTKSPGSRSNSNAEEDTELSKEERLRLNVIDEIINSEKDYANDLQIIIEHYVIPLATKEGKTILSTEDYCNLFSNIMELLDISYSVLNMLEEVKRRSAKKTTYVIGDVFFKLADDFKAYTIYCVYQVKALKTLEKCRQQKGFSEFDKKNEAKSELKGISLLGYLIKPVQRICKYPILLKELLKKTPENHPEYGTLVAALDKIEQVVSYINENKKYTENISKLTEIKNNTLNMPAIADFVKPIRSVVFEERLLCCQLVTKGANNTTETKNLNKEVIIYLMTDMFLCVKPSQKRKDKQKCLFFVTMDKLRVTDIFSESSEEFKYEVVDRMEEHKLVLSTRQQITKKTFVDECKRLQKENYLENQTKLMKEAEQYLKTFEFRNRTMNEKRLSELKTLSTLFEPGTIRGSKK